MSEGVCKGLNRVFCNIYPKLLPRKQFPGSSRVPHLPCALSLFARKHLRREGCHSQNRARVKGEGLQNEATSHQVLHHLLMDGPAGQEHEEALFFTLFTEFMGQLLRTRSCLNAKHVSKMSIRFVLTQEIAWNFQPVRCKAISYY